MALKDIEELMAKIDHPMKEIVVKIEDAEYAQTEIEKRTDYRLASVSNSGVEAGGVRLTFLLNECFKDGS